MFVVPFFFSFLFFFSPFKYQKPTVGLFQHEVLYLALSWNEPS